MNNPRPRLVAALLCIAAFYFLLIIGFSVAFLFSFSCYAIAQIFSSRPKRLRIVRAVYFSSVFVILAVFMRYHSSTISERLHFSSALRLLGVAVWICDSLFEFQYWKKSIQEVNRAA